jgi:hypothetical protein
MTSPARIPLRRDTRHKVVAGQILAYLLLWVLIPADTRG